MSGESVRTLCHRPRFEVRPIDHGIRHLPIVAEGEVVGVVSMRDALRAEIGARVDH